MGDNISNENLTRAAGDHYDIQINDSGYLGFNSNLYATQDGCIHATCFLGDGGTLSNISTGGGGGSNVIAGVPGQVAFYNNALQVQGDTGLTYDQTTQSLTVNGDLIINGNTYASNNIVTDDTIIELANNAPDGVDMGIIMQRPSGNVTMGYEGSTNNLVLSYTDSSAHGATITPDTTKNLPVDIYGNVNIQTLGSNVSLITNSSVKFENLDVGPGSNVVQIDPSTGLLTHSSDGGLLSNIQYTETSNLEQVVNRGNVTSNTVQFSNPTTAFVITETNSAVHFDSNVIITSDGTQVAIGNQAGNIGQQTQAVAIGNSAGRNSQQIQTVAIGNSAGRIDQQNYAVAVGANAGRTSQQNYSVAIGNQAGYTDQNAYSVAVGNQAGYTGQQSQAVAIGNQAGYTDQNADAIAVGNSAGYTDQQDSAVAIGNNAGSSNQNAYAIAVGFDAGRTSQQNYAVAIGNQAGNDGQNAYSVAIGNQAGSNNQNTNAIAIGNQAGRTSQQNYTVAIGNQAGRTSQQTQAVAIGNSAGFTGQQNYAVAVGTSAGRTDQQTQAVAVGTGAGNTGQNAYSIAVGYGAGFTGQQNYAVAVGTGAGYTGQNAYSIAVGFDAGRTGQQTQAVAIGTSAGYDGQQTQAVAIGTSAGYTGQQNSAIAVGNSAGNDGQQNYAVAIGKSAGQSNQGVNAIAIGNSAGATSQDDNTIVLNATGSALDTTVADSFYVKPIRNALNSNILMYDESTGEITYSSDGGLLSNIQYTETSNLEQVVNRGNVTSNTVQFSNTNVSLVTSGNVGINTSAPSTKLEVRETAGVDAVRIYGGAIGKDMLKLTRNATAGDPSTSVLAQIGFNGKNSDPQIYFDEGSVKFALGLKDSDGTFRIASSDTLGINDRLTIKQTGEVGIGTTSPSANLHVDGSVKFENLGVGLGSNIVQIDPSTGLLTQSGDVIVSGTAPQIAYYSGSGQISSSAVADITSSNIALINGSQGTPPLTFKNDPNTGIYLAGKDQLGISAGGQLRANVSVSGLTVGSVGSVGGAIKRTSATYANSWEDGHMGNSTQLVFTPCDFRGYNAGRGTAIASSQPDPGVIITSRWYGTTDGDGILVAQKVVPKGFIIDGQETIIIYTPAGSITNTTCYVSSQSYGIGSGTALTNMLSSSAFNTNTLVTLSGGGTTTGDGTSIITIYWEAGVGLTTANSPSGAVISMRRV